MKNPIFGALLIAAAPLALAACGEKTEAPAAPGDQNTIAGVEITNAHLVLPPVAGNPAAIYFDLANKGERSVTFRSVEVEGAARAEVHETIMQGDMMVMGEGHPFTLQPGDAIKFEPGGRHVMAFELGDDIESGSATEVTLIAAGGKRHSFEATAQAAGDDR